MILLDASLSNDADAFPGRVEQLKKLLESDANIKQFNVLVFDVAGRWLQPKGFLTNDADSRTKVLKQLKDVTPEGACDLAAALDRLTTPLFDLKPGTPVRNVLLSEGYHLSRRNQPGSGLAASFRSRCPFAAQFTCRRRKPRAAT